MIFRLPGDDGERKAAHDDPLTIEHLEKKLHEEEEDEREERDDDGVEEVGNEMDEKEMGKW